MKCEATKFVKLYNQGLTVKEVCIDLGIPTWKGYQIKQKLNLHAAERWEKAGMPARFNKTTREIMLGTLLGDGTLVKDGKCKYHRLKIHHGKKQQLYLEWLWNELSELKPSKIKPTGDKWGTLRFYSPPHPELENLYNYCYPTGAKQVTLDWVRELTPLSIAIWYMDDGGIQDCCKIATCAFSNESCEILLSQMEEKWSIKGIVRNYDYPRLFFNKENSQKLIQLISPYVIPSMRYKLKFRQYDPVARRKTYLRSKIG